MSISVLFNRIIYGGVKKVINGKTLVTRVEGIGDFLMFTGVLSEWAKNQDTDNLCLLVKPHMRELAELYLPKSNVFTVDIKKLESNFFYRRSWVKEMQTHGFDRIVTSIHRSSPIIKIMDFLAKESIGYEWESVYKRRLLNRFDILVGNVFKNTKGHYESVMEHEKYYCESILKKSLGSVVPRIPIQGGGFTENKPYMILLPQTGDEKKTYPVDRLLKFSLDLATKNDWEVVLLGGENQAFEGPVKNLTGSTSVLEAVRWISRAKLVIGSDTGLSHVGWILGRPTVFLYGGGHFGRFKPQGPVVRTLIKDMDCFGCNWSCPYPNTPYKCIDDISISEIQSACNELLYQSH